MDRAQAIYEKDAVTVDVEELQIVVVVDEDGKQRAFERGLVDELVGSGGVGTLTDVTEITGNIDTGPGAIAFTCAARSDQTVWCWGNNKDGALGDGTTTDSPTPVQTLI